MSVSGLSSSGFAPAAVAAQVLIAPLFEIWTRGKVSFDRRYSPYFQ